MSSELQPQPRASLVSARLSVMMFLEFAIWGSWAVLVAKHMKNIGFTDPEINYVYLTTALGAMLSPLIAGSIADRLMPSQLFTALVHLAGAGLLYLAWTQTEFWPFWTVILCYAVLYMPTIALTNAIAFHHMRDSKNFGFVRVFGTIGWIFINWALSVYLNYWEKKDPSVSHVGDCLLAAAILSVIMGVYCFTLPNTPPTKNARNPYAFLEALSLTSNRNFLILLLISFVVAIELPFYYNLTLLFLTEQGAGIGLPDSQANFAMSLGQVAEGGLMLLLAPSLRYLGMRTTIFLGILAWPVRYAVFAMGEPTWLVVAAQSLHGICYSFFFVGGMIAIERLSPKDVRASAQGLIVFATNGVGMLIGSLVAGYVSDYFSTPAGHDWPKIFMVPIAITILAGLAFLVMFNERKYQQDAATIEAQDAVAA